MFENKNVIVTGGSSGIGKATVIKFLEKGANVFVLDLDPVKGESIEKKYKMVKFYHVDVSDYHQIEFFFKEHIDKNKIKIDVLVNNAGIEISGAFHDFPIDDFNKLVDVNFKSIFYISQLVVRNMLRFGGGAIVSLASVSSIIAWPDDAVYNSTKAAVHLLTKSIATEYAQKNIRANCVAPAIIDTPMTERAIGCSSRYIEEKKKKGEVHPMKRLGKPEEVADAILFLASDKASFITGAILPVDGGYLSI